MNEDVKKILTESKNICIIPSQTNEPESLTAALALFYTLKDLGKNVNLIADAFPEKLNFLAPPLDYISSPKNFVISIPKTVAEISQIYYEKNEENVKIHVSMDKGYIKKEDIAFYFENAKPDVVITIGIQNFQKALEGKLDSFGYLLGAPVLNIDTNPENTRFGQINVTENTSLAEIVFDIAKNLKENAISAQTANCLLTGLVLRYENFQNNATTAETFELCAWLMKRGANRKNIAEALYAPPPEDVFTMEETAAELEPSIENSLINKHE